MAFNKIYPGPPHPSSADDASTSPSHNSSGVSESPRASPLSLGTITSPNARHGQYEEHDDLSLVPKVEDMDDDSAALFKTDPGDSSSTVRAVAPKRKRGRPKKEPKPEGTPSPKVTRIRSKTGCYTCRQRKKKCDELKPECGQCRLSNFECKGFPPKQIWQSGREKAIQRNRQRWAESGAAPLPPFIPGIENDIDWKYYQHYNEMLSKRLNIKSDENNPFLVHLLPMAQSHKALMHAILACSGSHLLQNSEAAAESEEMEVRQGYHWSQAVKAMCRDPDVRSNKPRLETLAQSVVHQLQTIVEGNKEGHWRMHVKAVRDMLSYKPEQDEIGAYSFFAEFFRYHDLSAYLTTSDPITIPDDELPKFFEFSKGREESFMAVCEGLEIPTRQIHALRGRVRQRRNEKKEPFVDYNILEEGRILSLDLEKIQCRHIVNSEEWICWQLYRVCIFLYLQRTISAMTPKGLGPSIQAAVTHGIEYLQSMTPESPMQSLLLLPIFLVGTCAWWKEDRPAIIDALNICEAYSHNGNIKHARNILERLWGMMDTNDDRVWDYEDFMKNDMGMDLLLT